MSVHTLVRVPDGEEIWGQTRARFMDFTFSSAYPSATGEVISAKDVGMKEIKGVKVVGGNQASGVLVYTADLGVAAGRPATSVAVRAFYPTGGATASPAALADPIVTSGAATASAVDATTPNITPGQAKEVANNTDLSGIVLRLLIMGR